MVSENEASFTLSDATLFVAVSFEAIEFSDYS